MSVPILEPGLLWSIAMANGQRQPLGRLKSGLIAATFGLTLVAVAVLPAAAQELEQPDTTATVQGIAVEPAAGNASAAQSLADHHDRGIDWRPVLTESLLFLTAQHLARFVEDKTAKRLGGPFVNDWFDSVRSLNRFSDGGKITTNWVAHPMMGSVATHILGQNDPEYLENKVGSGDRYWRAKGKQFLFATVYSVQFEIGPLSESSLGNIHQAGIDFVPHVQPGNAVVGGRGPDSATRPSADACDASEVGQYPDSSPEPDQGFCQRARLQAPLGLRRGELLLSETHHAARPRMRYSFSVTPFTCVVTVPR